MKVGIVGLGLIGGSIAKALHPFHHTIIAIDARPKSIEKAFQDGVIDEGYSEVSPSLFTCDIIYLCLYPQATLEFLNTYIDQFRPHTVLTDVSGIKQLYQGHLDHFFVKGIQVVLGHPMAGSETYGYENALGTLFQGTNYLLIPQPKNSEDSLNLVESLARQMGCIHVHRLTSEAHDQLIAYMSHLPHIIAASILHSEDNQPNLHEYSGRSFKDMTRVGAMNEKLWAELLIQNQTNVVPIIDHFLTSLFAYQQAIQTGDTEKLTALLQMSAKRRNDFHD